MVTQHEFKEVNNNLKKQIKMQEKRERAHLVGMPSFFDDQLKEFDLAKAKSKQRINPEILTKYEVAKLVGVKPSSVYAWFSRKTNPSIKNLIKLAEIYKETVDDTIKRINR